MAMTLKKYNKKMIETMMFGMQLLSITYACYWVNKKEQEDD